MKKTPLKRSAFKRKKEWKNLRHYSKHRVKDLKIYTGLRLQFLAENPICGICTKRHSTQIHHKKGRGLYLNDLRFFLGVCLICHTKVTYHPEWAFRMGYSVDRIGLIP